MRACSQSYLSSPGVTLFLLNLALFFFCFLLKLFSSFVKLSPSWSSPHVLGLGLQHTMGKKEFPSTFLNFFTFVLRTTWSLTPPFSSLFKPKLIKDMKNNTTNDMPRETRDIFFMWMFLLHTLRWLCQSLCHNKNWNKSSALWRDVYLVSSHNTLKRVRCVTSPNKTRLRYSTSSPSFSAKSVARVKKNKKEKKTGKKRKKKIYFSALQGALRVRRPTLKAPHRALTLMFFTDWIFFFFCLFFFMGEGLRRRARTACGLRLPKRLNRRGNFAFWKLVDDYYVFICL